MLYGDCQLSFYLTSCLHTSGLLEAPDLIRSPHKAYNRYYITYSIHVPPERGLEFINVRQDTTLCLLYISRSTCQSRATTNVRRFLC